MKLINADTVVHWQSYDDETESYPEHTGTIAEFLDAMTDEGCPESMDALPSVLQEAIWRIEKKVDEVYGYPKTEYAEGYVNAGKAVIKMLKNLSPVDAVSVIRCNKCDFWDRDHVSCEGLAKCLTGEGGIRYRNRNDFCSRGIQMDGKDT